MIWATKELTNAAERRDVLSCHVHSPAQRFGTIPFASKCDLSRILKSVRVEDFDNDEAAST